MRRFAFRLQRALRFGLLREKQKKTQIANALQRMAFLQKYLKQIDDKLQKSLRDSYSDLMSLSGEANRQAIVPFIEESKRVEALLVEEREALAKNQNDLKRLSQRRRSLESLREKRSQEFKLQKSRADQKSLDEAVSLKRARAIALNLDQE